MLEKNFFSYSWLNEVIVPIPSDLKRDLPEELVKMQLIHSLTQNLYTNFYCKGFIASTKRFSTRMSLPTVKVDYLKQLSSSNNGKGYLDDKWTVISRESDRVVAVKNGCRLILKTCEYLSPENKPGGNVFQCMPKDLHFLSPGFLMAVGNNDLQLIDACPTIRFYWNLRAQGAIPLMSAITTKLNKAGLPFRFKILDQPDQFIRCDSAVLYTFRKDYELIRNAIESVHSEVMPYLKYETPVFTKNLAFGLGLAESPEHGNSFGIHRCQILAEGIVNAFCHNQKSVAKRLTVVRQYFEEKEINLEKPYLNPGSADIFHFDSGKISNRCFRLQLLWDTYR